MSLRVFKTYLKRTNAADKESREMYDSARLDEQELGLPYGHSILHEYSLEATAYSRWCYIRTKRAFRKLRPRQRKKMVAKINARKGLRNTLDKVTLRGL